MYTNSPAKPTWASNISQTCIINLGYNIFEYKCTFNPSSLQDLGTYIIQYLVTETGVGSCTFIPTIREISVTVLKKVPVIAYNIPDNPNMRAAIPFTISFPESP